MEVTISRGLCFKKLIKLSKDLYHTIERGKVILAAFAVTT
jgi:hypothetical protein